MPRCRVAAARRPGRCTCCGAGLVKVHSPSEAWIRRYLYLDFDQVSDQEVIDALARPARAVA